MSQSQTSEAKLFSDSAKVLTDLIEILGEYEGSPTRTLVGGIDLRASGLTGPDTLRLMQEVVDGAPKTQIIRNLAT